MKKNTWKKLMSLALGAMMMLSLLTGCGSKTEDSAPAGSTGKEVPPHPKDRRRRCGVCADPAGGGVLRLFLGL